MNNGLCLDRRSFFGSVMALGAMSGCRTLFPGLNPDLRFGVVSDIHVTTPRSARLFRRALAYFRSRGVDAVLVSGDLTDWGLKSTLVAVKSAWDAEMAGTGIVPLFCTGNHDFEGWWYGDMTVDMHAQGYDESEGIVKLGGMAKVWTEVMGEPYAPIRRRTVKGYDFISTEYRSEKELAGWLRQNGASLKGTKPFFYFQHIPIFDDTGKLRERESAPNEGEALRQFPNCLAFTGHVHHPYSMETNIRQDGFTEISVPSLSYASSPRGYENGSAYPRKPDNARQSMEQVPNRFNLRGGQGYVVSVFGSELIVERRDLEEEVEGAKEWLLTLPVGARPPYAIRRRLNESLAPEFPADATLELENRNTELRNGQWSIVLKCDFPTAFASDGIPAFDYEIRAVPKDGSAPMVKLFLSPAFAKLPKYEPEIQHFWFNVAELPQDRDYVIEVRARNAFGKGSRPLVSSVFHGKPGLDKADRTNVVYK